MFKIIKKIFIKDYENVDKQEVRLRYGITAGIIGIVSNLFLFIAKIVIGLISNSITIIADAINNLSDSGSSAVTVIGFKMASKPADKEHPFGHARYEYITALLTAITVLAIGVLLGKSSVEKIIKNENVSINIYTFIVLILAMAIKLWQMLLYKNFGKTINSEALIATSCDSRNDIIITGAVLLSSVIVKFAGQTKVSIDGIFGLAVSLFVVISAAKLIKETINPLIGIKPDAEVVTKIKDILLSYEGVIGIHDLMIHNYGAGNSFVLAHIEVPASGDLLKSHDMIDNIEREFASLTGMHLCIHMDPVETDNEEVLLHKKHAQELLLTINKKFSLHDFRMVIGETHTNILFDVVVPYSEKITSNEIVKYFEENFEGKRNKYYFIIKIDNLYI